VKIKIAMSFYTHRTYSFMHRLFPRYMWRKNTSRRVVHLTFDDGPVPEVTDFVLEVLQAYNAKATFFCVGDNVRKYPSIFKRIVKNGHSVGNHTFNHLNGWKTEDEEYLANIAKCDEVMEAHGAKPTFFRPPYGTLKPSQANTLLDKKRVVLWDVLTGDFDVTLSPEKCLSATLKHIRPGSIITFHDSYKAQPNLEYALPRTLAHLQNMGYTFEGL